MSQIPQYLLIGTSEILSAVTSLEFFYAEAPTTVRGVSAGLNLLTTALGSWMTVPLLTLVSIVIVLRMCVISIVPSGCFFWSLAYGGTLSWIT